MPFLDEPIISPPVSLAALGRIHILNPVSRPYTHPPLLGASMLEFVAVNDKPASRVPSVSGQEEDVSVS